MKDSNQRDPSADDKQSIVSLFAESLRRWRRERGLSQKALAEKAGVGETTIIAYEQGTRAAGIDKIATIAQVLNVSVIELLIVPANSTLEKEVESAVDQAINNAVLSYRVNKGIEILNQIGFRYRLDDLIRLFPPAKICRNAEGELVSEPPDRIFHMDLETFATVFERIATRAIASANLREITDDELSRL